MVLHTTEARRLPQHARSERLIWSLAPLAAPLCLQESTSVLWIGCPGQERKTCTRLGARLVVILTPVSLAKMLLISKEFAC